MLDATVLTDSKVKKQGYKAIMSHQIKIKKDYDIVKLMIIIENNQEYKDKIINGFDSFDDFKESTALMGIRTTLGNALKISNTEALNYAMGFPFNFKLKSFVKILTNRLLNGQEMNKHTKIVKIKHLIKLKTEKTEAGDVARLKLGFDEKKKLISQNFESTTHIDVTDFKNWIIIQGFG
jgi:hypothetical protein